MRRDSWLLAAMTRLILPHVIAKPIEYTSEPNAETRATATRDSGMLLGLLYEWWTTRGASVAPRPSAPPSLSPGEATAPPRRRVHRLLVVLLLTVALASSISWTIWLVMFTISPNGMANYLAATERYDEGSFWLLQDPPASLMWLGVSALAIVAIGYVYVAAKLARLYATTITLRWRRFVLATDPACAQTPRRCNLKTVAGAAISSTFWRKSKLQPRESQILPQELRERELSNRQLDRPRSLELEQMHAFPARVFGSMSSESAEFALKVFDLGVQGVWLFRQILETGSEIIFVALCTALIAANALLWTWSMATGGSRLNRVLVELAFDFLLLIAVPILMLWHALANLAFDYQQFDINLELYPPVSLQRSARALADPVLVLTANYTLDMLRIFTVFDFFTRVGSNLALCRRFNTVVELLESSSNPSAHRKGPDATGTCPSISSDHKLERVKCCTKVLYMFAFAAAVITVSTVAIVQSQRACESHPECAVHAHRWAGSVADGDLYRCPCRILVDVEVAPKTYAEWLDPKDVSSKVAQLATLGTLQGIQLVNRKMVAFPDELQHCAGSLKYLSLMYTHLTALPPWFNRFTRLEYLFIQGKPDFTGDGFRNLELVPLDAFEGMSALAFVHLAEHIALPALPSFQSLGNLRTLTLAFLQSIQELPDLRRLAHLERMVLLGLARVNALPDLSALKKLRRFHLMSLPVCCNGFVTGSCDLSAMPCANSMCYGGANAEVEHSDATWSILQRFSSTICPQQTPSPSVSSFSNASVVACNGVLYRECSSPDGVTKAMCYNGLFLPIWCNSNDKPIEARRREIVASVGPACDPAVEAWLGCQAP